MFGCVLQLFFLDLNNFSTFDLDYPQAQRSSESTEKLKPLFTITVSHGVSVDSNHPQAYGFGHENVLFLT